MKKDRREYFKIYHRTVNKGKRMALYYKNRLGYLKDKKCAKCGSVNRLEIDHINPKEKNTHVIWLWSEERRQEELKKCQVLCYHCHKLKTRSENIKEHSYNAYKINRCRCSLCYNEYRKVCEAYNERRRQKRAAQRLLNKVGAQA